MTAAAPILADLSCPSRARRRDATASLLIVEDHADNRRALGKLLRAQGYRVFLAAEGRQALKLLPSRQFDLVLLDVVMQGVSGLEVLKVLRQTYSATDLPVIMVTGLDQSDDIVQALSLGANDYVTKPLDFPVLLARVRTQLRLKRAVEHVLLLEKDLARRNTDLEAANARMQADLEAAARVQEAFLPQQPCPLPGAAAAWVFRPCARLAGDMLNVFPLNDRSVGFYLLDVSGHGVAASLLAVTLSRILHPAADRASPLVRRVSSTSACEPVSPAEVAAHLTARFPWDSVAQQFFTIIYGVLDGATGICRYMAAGHPGPILCPVEGPAQNFKHPALPIGFAEVPYQEHEIRLRPGDRLVLYSDGAFEGTDAEGQAFGVERLRRAVESGRSSSLTACLQSVVANIETWGGRTPARDDISLLALEFAPADSH